MYLSKKRREEIYEMFGGRCAYCGEVLPRKGWHADHIDPVIRALEYYKDGRGVTRMRSTGKLERGHNDRFDNLFPACYRCNIEKGSGSVEDFRIGLERMVYTLRRDSAKYRHLERFGMVSVVKTRVVFYFEDATMGTL